MDIPISIAASSIASFCVCCFKDNQHSIEAPPHFYIVFPVTDNAALLFLIITSQIERRKKYYDATNPNNKLSLIKVDKDSLPFLKKTSVIDCNQAELIYIKELENRIDPQYGFNIEIRKIPEPLQKEIKIAIRNSTLVKEFIKEMILV